MCRLAAYLGPSIRLDRFLLEPPHSLYRQSWACREMREAVVNADGYGIGFLNGDGAALTYKSMLPVWADSNLPSLGAALSSSLWAGNVRSATPGQATGLHNTQPFTGGGLFFLHNGYLDDFEAALKTALHSRLPPELAASIEGSSDSEYLYAWMRAHEGDGAARMTALQKALVTLPEIISEAKALLNIIVADNRELLACRHALKAPCPSLYYCVDHAHYPEAVLVASERFDDDSAWQPVPEHHLLRLTPGCPPQELPL